MLSSQGIKAWIIVLRLASCVLHKMRPRKEWITTGLASCLCTLFGESFVLFIRIVLLAALVV